MRYLPISILIFSLISCKTLPITKGLVANSINKTIENTYFSDKNIDYVYKAKINVNNNHLGGLLIIKKIKKEHHRVVFTTEFGNKVFDFEFIDNKFKVNFIIKKIKNKIVINALRKDFQLLINQYNFAVQKFNNSDYVIYQSYLNKKNNYYFIKNKLLRKIIMTSKHKEKVSVIFSDTSLNLAKKIKIIHHNFNMNILLNYIN